MVDDRQQKFGEFFYLSITALSETDPVKHNEMIERASVLAVELRFGERLFQAFLEEEVTKTLLAATNETDAVKRHELITRAASEFTPLMTNEFYTNFMEELIENGEVDENIIQDFIRQSAKIDH